MVEAPCRLPPPSKLLKHGAHDALSVNAAVLVEAFVFCGQNGLLHDVRDILNAHDRPALFAEFTDQVAFGGVNPQRNLRTIVGQYFQRRQVWIGQDQNHGSHGDDHRGKADNEQNRIKNPAGKVRQGRSPGEGESAAL